MMPLLHRKAALEIVNWVEKDLTLRKIVGESRRAAEDSKKNLLLNRAFFADMLSLSGERYRKIVEYDCEKRLFLKKQRLKAERTMPELMTFVEPANDTKKSARSNSAVPPSTRPFSSERLQRLSMPKGQRYHSKEHVRSCRTPLLAVEDLFSNIGPLSDIKSPRIEKTKNQVNDPRFNQLVKAFTDVYERPDSHRLTVQGIIRANSSLEVPRKKKCFSARPLSGSMDFHRLIRKQQINLIDI